MFLLQKFQVSVFLCIFIFLHQANSEEESSTHQQLQILLNNNLDQCSSLFITVSSNPKEFKQEKNNILHGLILGIILSADISFQQCNFIENAYSESNATIIPLQRQNRKFGNCLTTILLINSFTTNTFSNLAKIIVPKLMPIIYKDMEKVFAFSSQEIAEPFLKSPDFGMKLKFKIFGLYNITEQPKLTIYTSCDFCGINNIFQVKEHEVFKDYEKNFQQSLLRFSVSDGTKGRLNYTTINGKVVPTNGMLVAVLEYLKLRLNFTFELKPSMRGGGTGIKLPNGSFDGVVGDVLLGHADIGMSTAESYDRTQVVGFTSYVVYETLKFVSGPLKKFYPWEAVCWPFSDGVWITTGILSLVSIVLIILVYKILKPVNNNNKSAWETGRLIEYILGSFVGQSNRLPRYIPITIQIYLSIWLFAAFVLVTAYLSKIFGFLTFPVVEKVPSNIEELSKSKFDWGLAYVGGVAFTLITKSQIPAFIEISKKLQVYKNHEKCYRKAIVSNFICISYESLAKHYAFAQLSDKYGNSPLVLSRYSLSSVPVGMAIEKRVVFGPNLERGIEAFTSMGLIVHWEEKDLQELQKMRNYNSGNDTTNLEEDEIGKVDETMLTFKHFRGAAVLFSAGTFLAILAFLGESIFQLYKISIASWHKIRFTLYQVLNRISTSIEYYVLTQ